MKNNTTEDKDWYRLSKEEISKIEKTKRKINWVNTILLSAAFAFASVISISAGFKGKGVPYGSPVEFSKAIESFPHMFLIGFVVIVLFQYLKWPLSSNTPRTTMICVVCKQFTLYEYNKKCSCGGSLEPREHWTQR